MKRLASAVIGLILVCTPVVALAGFQAPSAEQPPVGALPTDTAVFQGATLIETVSIVINWVLGFVGIIVFALFLFAGFQYATAGGNESQTESARKTMINAVVGMIIIFFAFVLSNAVLSFVFYNENSTAGTTTQQTQN